MKRARRIPALILALVLALGLTVPVSAAGTQNDDFVINQGVLIQYVGPGGDVVIPDGVTMINQNAFAGKSSVTSVTIPDGVTSIGAYAFSKCSSLVNISIPGSVVSVGQYAFLGTPWLENQGDFPVVNGILLIYQGSGGDVVIPKGVTTISRRAFYRCDELTSVVIPDGVTVIGEQAFEYCKNLASVTIPGSVTGFGGNVFYDTPWLKSQGQFVIVNNILLAYHSQEEIEDVVVPDGVTEIAGSAFYGKSSVYSVILPDTVTRIGSEAFSYCRNLRQITIPASVTSIGVYAFTAYSNQKEKVAICGEKGSYAEAYAKKEGLDFYVVGDHEDPAPTAPTAPITSAPSAWAKSEVEGARMAGLVPELTGGPSYQDAITREQFAELVVQFMRAVDPDIIDSHRVLYAFEDSHNIAVMLASAAGIVNGVGNNRFAPAQTTNREQIATMIARAVAVIENAKGIDMTPAPASVEGFTDKGRVSGWAVEGMGILAANGIMNGTSGTTLSPKNSCTVEQSICLLYRVYQAVQAQTLS